MQQLIEKTSDVREVVDAMIEYRTHGVLSDPTFPAGDELREKTDTRLREMLNGRVDIVAEEFLDLGGVYFELLDGSYLVDFPDFLFKKHQEYGTEPLLISGIPGILDRMLHKLARIRNLKSKTRDSSVDTHIQLELQDLLGYSVLAYLFIKKL